MSDWRRVSDADAERTREGGTWAYVGGKLRRISVQAIGEQIRAAAVAQLPELFNQMAVESLHDVQDLSFEVSPDMSTVTMTLQANGHTATRNWPLDLAVN